MKKTNASADSSEARVASPAIDDVQGNWQRVVRRRSFLQGGIGVAVYTTRSCWGFRSILAPASLRRLVRDTVNPNQVTRVWKGIHAPKVR